MADEAAGRQGRHPGRPQAPGAQGHGRVDSFANRSSWPNFFSRLVARLQWDPAAIDLAPDARDVAGAPGGAPRPPDDAPRRLLRGRGRGRRAAHAVRRRGQGGDVGVAGEPDGLGLLPPAPRRAAPRAAVRSHRRRGARAAGRRRRPSGAPRPGSTSRPRSSSSSRSGCRRWPPSSPRGAAGLARASASTTCCSRGSSSTPGSTRCSTTSPTARCPGCARASSASSATSAGTSASACAA